MEAGLEETSPKSPGNDPEITSPASQGKSQKPPAFIRLHLEFNQISPPAFLPPAGTKINPGIHQTRVIPFFRGFGLFELRGSAELGMKTGKRRKLRFRGVPGKEPIPNPSGSKANAAFKPSQNSPNKRTMFGMKWRCLLGCWFQKRGENPK